MTQYIEITCAGEELPVTQQPGWKKNTSNLLIINSPFLCKIKFLKPAETPYRSEELSLFKFHTLYEF